LMPALAVASKRAHAGLSCPETLCRRFNCAGRMRGEDQMRDHARAMLWFAAAGVAVLAGVFASGGRVQADDPNSAPNPYHVVEHWAKLPEGRVWGQAIGVDIDRDGTSVWVFDRCGAKACEGSNLAPVQKFDAAGHLVASFGSGMFK
jgi:hypothetical protein